MSLKAVPTLDITRFRSQNATERRAFVTELDRAAREIGFLILKNHGLSGELQRRAYEKVAAFFALPEKEKLKYEVPGTGGVRGYTPFGREHAKYTKVGDLKEFFHVGMEVPKGHALAHAYPPNVSVPVVPSFDTTLRELYGELLNLGLEVLRGFALALELSEDFFDDYVRYGNSVLRPIHYPPLKGQEAPQAERASAHEDINLITLLIGASAPGLQVLRSDGAWIDATAQGEEIVVNVGDMLQRLTNRRYRSTTHRVVNPPAAQAAQNTRFSMPMFIHPVSEMSLAALAQCVAPGTQPQEAPILAGDFLLQRLRENGVL